MAIFGMLAGYLLGGAIALYQAENWLDEYSELYAGQRDEASSEAMRILAEIKKSQDPYCSDAEIAHFRELVFRAIYLKDAGRIRDGVIDCSATAGRPGKALGQFRPEFTQADGSMAYRNLAPIRDANVKRPGLQLGNGYVVFSRRIPVTLGPIPMRVTFTMNPASAGDTGAAAKASAQGTKPELITNGKFRVGDTLYATRCPSAYFKCVTSTTTVNEALRGERGTIVAATALGGLTGGLLGLLTAFTFSRSLDMEQQLRRAIADDKLELAYQPIVNIDSGRIVGAEALARWTNEDGEPIGPQIFIPIAEARGFIGSITRLVVRRALHEFGDILRARPDFRLNVNVSAADLADAKFLPMLEEAIKRAFVPAKRLAIEITESSTANQTAAMETIRELRRRGHSIQIDDFGTGYSSLSYLLYLSVDTIKVDKAFTKAIGTESVTVAILPQILAMAESLGVGVVAEGVETQQQANYFSGSGRRIEGQGWFFGLPVPAAEFRSLLAEQRGKAPNFLDPDSAEEMAAGSSSSRREIA
jgi:sensor c-di-GMP phosphodiesterase-like protein